MPRLERVFGLTINEFIGWGTAFADLEKGVLGDGYESGILCPIPEGKLPQDPKEQIFLETHLREGLATLHKEKKYIFDETVRVGVSTIGVVNRQDRLLISVARKKWVTEKDNKGIRQHLVDFNSLFIPKKSPQLFSKIDDTEQIIVQNDAPARCMTEYIYGFKEGSRPKSLLYLMAGEGLNGGIVFSGDFPDMVGHPELGHCTPQLHPYDMTFNPNHSGCPKHHYCFEGLVSNARFRQQWGYDLCHLSLDHPAWDIAAFYLGQMAMIGTLMLGPERIIFGGELFYGPKGLALISKIQKEFTRLNAGYLLHLETLEDAERLITRASFDSIIWTMSALTMASSHAEGRLPMHKVAENADALVISAETVAKHRADRERNRVKKDTKDA